jgi:hypothetical protein
LITPFWGGKGVQNFLQNGKKKGVCWVFYLPRLKKIKFKHFQILYYVKKLCPERVESWEVGRLIAIAWLKMKNAYIPCNAIEII